MGEAALKNWAGALAIGCLLVSFESDQQELICGLAVIFFDGGACSLQIEECKARGLQEGNLCGWLLLTENTTLLKIALHSG